MMMTREQGTIAVYFPARGFGFLSRDNGDQNLFFHLHGFRVPGQEIEVGRRVEFLVGTDAMGRLRACDMILLSDG